MDEVLHYRKLYLAERARLRQALQTPGRAEPYGRGLFYYPLAVRHRVQLRLQRPALYREGRVPGQPVLQAERAHPLEKLLKAPRPEAPQLQQDALGKAGADVRPGKAVFVRLKEHAPVLGRDGAHPHMPQLVAEGPLQTKETGRAEPKPRAARRFFHPHHHPRLAKALFIPINIQ